MALELHSFTALCCVEIVNVNHFFLGDTSKEVTPVRETDFIAELYWYKF